jgi:CPA1 family monovalent cation:H+ antiporter
MRIRVIWDTLIFLLNGVIFILIGLQLPEIISQLGNYSVADLVKYSLMISVITILIRILWVFGGAFSQKLLGGHTKEHDFYSRQDQSLWKNVLIISWTGTRGVVSLATALALPTIVDSGAPFPQRPLILFLAFVVIFVTLIVQGLSLPLLLRILKVHNIEDSGQEAKELALVMADNIIHFIDTDFPQTLILN